MNLLLELKTTTAPEHAAVEKAVPIAGDRVSEGAYLSYLTSLYGYYEPLEGKLLDLPGLLDAVPDFYERKKSEALKSDLLSLGLPTGKIDVAPRCSALPAIETVDDALGCLYVLEGSTLGGQVLLRNLYRHLGPAVSRATRFLGSYGPRLGLMWGRFGEHLTAAAAGTSDPRRILHSATSTFKTLRLWLEHRSAPTVTGGQL